MNDKMNELSTETDGWTNNNAVVIQQTLIHDIAEF